MKYVIIYPQYYHLYSNVVIDIPTYENMGIDTKIMFLSLTKLKNSLVTKIKTACHGSNNALINITMFSLISWYNKTWVWTPRLCFYLLYNQR